MFIFVEIVSIEFNMAMIIVSIHTEECEASHQMSWDGERVGF